MSSLRIKLEVLGEINSYEIHSNIEKYLVICIFITKPSSSLASN